MSSRNNNNNNKKPNKKRNQSGSPQDDPRWSPKHTSCSKSASYLLRHGAKKEGLPISDDGFVQVDELMKMKTMKPFSRQLLYETVEWNGKQRFFIKKENDIEYIRANQGHTLAVPKLELVPITDASNYPVVLHGTYLAVWPKIKVEGLKRMNRNHIHFASGKFGEVKSGVRSNVEIIIYIDLAAAIKDGFKFFLSDNGVILGEGGANGALPPKYITHAISTTNNQPFDPDFPKSDFPKFVAKNNNNNNNNNANNVNTNNNNNKNETQELEWPGRSSEEVFNRLKWDSKYDSTECIIGYEDRFTGIQEISLTAWEHRDVTADAFIPWHRVYYFKYKDEVIWDREKKTDLVFGGEKKELPSKNKKEKKNNNDSDDTDTESEPLEYIVVLDFEATCDESKSFKPQEIIEFPSVLYNVKEQKVEAEFQKYVKPTARPKLTKFCTSLTGITQTQVDNGILITEALKEYRLWLIEHKLIDEKDNDLKRWSLCTCGDWDLNTMLPSQAKLLNLNTPRYFKRFVNIKKVFSAFTNTKGSSMVSMLQYFQLDLQGRHHSGIDDCRNITRCLEALIKQGIPNNLLQPTTDKIKQQELKEKEKSRQAQQIINNKKVDPEQVQKMIEKAKPFVGDQKFLDSLKLEATKTTSGREKALGVLTHYITSQLKKDTAFTQLSTESRKSFLTTLKVSILLPYLQQNQGWPKN